MGLHGKQQEGKRLLTLCFLFIDRGRTTDLGVRDERNMMESTTLHWKPEALGKFQLACSGSESNLGARRDKI